MLLITRAISPDGPWWSLIHTKLLVTSTHAGQNSITGKINTLKWTGEIRLPVQIHLSIHLHLCTQLWGERNHHLSVAYHGVVIDQTITHSFKIDQYKLRMEKLRLTGALLKSPVWKKAQLVRETGFIWLQYPHSIVLSSDAQKNRHII